MWLITIIACLSIIHFSTTCVKFAISRHGSYVPWSRTKRLIYAIEHLPVHTRRQQYNCRVFCLWMHFGASLCRQDLRDVRENNGCIVTQNRFWMKFYTAFVFKTLIYRFWTKRLKLHTTYICNMWEHFVKVSPHIFRSEVFHLMTRCCRSCSCSLANDVLSFDETFQTFQLPMVCIWILWSVYVHMYTYLNT